MNDEVNDDERAIKTEQKNDVKKQRKREEERDRE